MSTNLQPSAQSDTLMLIDAMRVMADDHAKLLKELQEQRRMLVRTETRLVRLINHLGADSEIKTRRNGEAP